MVTHVNKKVTIHTYNFNTLYGNYPASTNLKIGGTNWL